MPVCPRCEHHDDRLGSPCPDHPELRHVREAARQGRTGRDPVLGQVVAGRFAIVSVVGEGGIGRVYEALDEQRGGHTLAVKVLKRSHVDNDTVRKRFDREARIMASLEHPNLVRLHDHGELPDGRLYIAMDLVVGKPLDELGAPPDADTVMRVAVGIASGLAEAHRNQVTHRDLKPGNVLVTSPGIATSDPNDTGLKLVDFGIARADAKTSTLTKTGMLFGTPAYMSPEQAMGDTDIGPPADVYAFGVMLYEMVAGRRPFDGDQALVLLMAHANQPPPPLTVRAGLAIPDGLVGLAMRCLAKAPAERPADGAALLTELRGLRASMSVATIPRAGAGDGVQSLFDVGTVPMREARRRPVALIAVGCVVLLAVSVGIGLWLGSPNESSARADEASLTAEAEAGESAGPEQPVAEPVVDEARPAPDEPPPRRTEPAVETPAADDTAAVSDEPSFDTSIPVVDTDEDGLDNDDDLRQADPTTVGEDSDGARRPRSRPSGEDDDEDDLNTAEEREPRKSKKTRKHKSKKRKKHDEKSDADKTRERLNKEAEKARKQLEKDAEKARKELEKRRKQLGF